MKNDRCNRENNSSPQSLKYRRVVRERRVCKYVCVCTEGTLTEESYLDCVVGVFRSQRIKLCKEGEVGLKLLYDGSKKNASYYLLKRAEEKRKQIVREKGSCDSVWIINDRDSKTHSLEQLREIEKWRDKNVQERHWIFSNPRIEESWLDIHCSTKYANKKNQKQIEVGDFSYEQIIQACKKARQIVQTYKATQGKNQTKFVLYEQEGSLMYEIVEFIGKEYQLCSEDSRGVVRWIEEKS